MLTLDADTKIALYSSLWGLILLLELTRLSRPRQGTVGLPFVLLMAFTSMHCAAVVHLIPGYDHTQDPYLASMNYTRDTVADGLEASFLAMLAAFLGFLLAEKGAPAALPRGQADAQVLANLKRVSLLMIAIGAVTLVIQTGTLMLGLAFPGFQAILFGPRSLVAVGAIGLIAYEYRTSGSRRALVLALIFAVAVPALFLITTAILEDSIVLSMAIFIFYLTLSKGTGMLTPWLRNMTLISLAIATAIVFSAGYMQTRTVLRETLRYGGGVGDAVRTAADLAGSLEASALFDNPSLALLDGRLNQNLYIGLTIEYLRTLPNLHANGDTILLALAGVVPRFIWPNKPERGGSAFMSKYTGVEFDEEASFGVGPIFELYVNFAYYGIFFGFLPLGYLIRKMDMAAARNMAVYSIVGATPPFLICIAIIQPLADIIFLVTGVAAAFLIGKAVTTAGGAFLPPAPLRPRAPRQPPEFLPATSRRYQHL